MTETAKTIACPDCRPEFGQTLEACTKRECPMKTGFAEESLAVFRRALTENAPPTRPATDERGWLIERYINNRLHYWNAGSGRNGRRDGFTDLVDDAVRFCREEDASIVLFRVCDGQGRVAEHMWVPLRADHAQGIVTRSAETSEAQAPSPKAIEPGREAMRSDDVSDVSETTR